MQKFREILLKKPEIVNPLIAILVIVLYLGLFFRPKIKEVFSKLAEASRLKAKVVTTEKDWANIDSLKKQVLQLNKKKDYYEKRLPSKKEIPSILEHLSSAAKELNVKIIEIRPIEQDKEDALSMPSLYYKVPILLRAECGYHQLGRFLSKLESADRFMKISDIEIMAASPMSNIHNVQLIVVTYGMLR